MSGENTVRISGVLVAKEAMRWTPARVPVLELRIEHQSRQMEAGAEREVSCELSLRAVGPAAQQIEVVAPGSRLAIEGFLAAKSARNRAPVLHIRTFELLEGN
ncbi:MULTISPECIES: primosomal replication protein N [unclassified Uliginosibacterium]|uniref:primosomal replication protein N n=1 Tax=unclassified Uliginosibacterium TaxID=2621521 RepID=UPI0020B149CF|nr:MULTISPECIES: primosomal replication protein N [unclassified Uliginosibacterium]MDO6385727.1 primosomal replication protein N [Uliginosibacterium sp. 31-12]